MKLAQSWTEDAPSLVTAAAFHDEVDEVDEVDEAKDGCGGGGVAEVRAKEASHQQQSPI